MKEIATFICALGLMAMPVSASQIYNISFDAGGTYSGSFGLDTVTDTLVAVDFLQGDRSWSVPDLVLYSSYVGSGVYYLIGGKPNGSGIQISPVATDSSENDFSLSFTLLFGSPRTVVGGAFQSQTVGKGYSTIAARVTATAVPELESWIMMASGLGLIGCAMRTRRKVTAGWSVPLR